MTNEEKILAMLARMQADMNDMKADINGLQADMEAGFTKVNTQIENGILPKLKLLAEGHQMLAQTLAPNSRVDALEGDVNLLKVAVQNTNSEVEQLKKAQ